MSTPQHPDSPIGEPAGEPADVAAAGPEDATATPAAVPAAPRAEDGDDLDARFLAIVSGIAPSMRWQPVDEGSQPGDGAPERTQERTQDRTGEQADRTVPGDGSSDLWRAAGLDSGPPGDLLDRPGGPLPPARPIPPPLPDRGSRGVADTADERSRRRAARRQERAEELAAFEAEKAEREREHAEDDAHYEPPPPPPLPRLRGRTVAALLVSAAGVLLLARPTLLQLNQDVSIVLAVLLILGGLGVLVAGLHRPPTDGSDGWDDGARV